MCDASDWAAGVILGQRHDKHFHPIYYASKMLTPTQENYTSTEKELLAIVYIFDKFYHYLVISKVMMYTDLAALQYLLTRSDVKPWLIWWVLLLHELDLEIRDKRGFENDVVDYLPLWNMRRMNCVRRKKWMMHF